MAERNAIVAVYSAGIIQGVALVTFPAASAIFSSPAYFHLSRTQYGGDGFQDSRSLSLQVGSNSANICYLDSDMTIFGWLEPRRLRAGSSTAHGSGVHLASFRAQGCRWLKQPLSSEAAPQTSEGYSAV